MVSRKLSTKNYSDDQLNCFIDFVSFVPQIHMFSKIKFVAAMRYLTVRYKPDIANTHFQNKMPGMMGYQQSQSLATIDMGQ